MGFADGILRIGGCTLTVGCRSHDDPAVAARQQPHNHVSAASSSAASLIEDHRGVLETASGQIASGDPYVQAAAVAPVHAVCVFGVDLHEQH